MTTPTNPPDKQPPPDAPMLPEPDLYSRMHGSGEIRYYRSRYMLGMPGLYGEIEEFYEKPTVENLIDAAKSEHPAATGKGEDRPHCMVCKKDAIPNIPRMGWDGGAAHADGSPLCITPEPPVADSLRVQRYSADCEAGIPFMTVDDSGQFVGWEEHSGEVDRLERELAAAQADSKRLEWLFGNEEIVISREIQHGDQLFTTREDIDDAMREGEK